MTILYFASSYRWKRRTNGSADLKVELCFDDSLFYQLPLRSRKKSLLVLILIRVVDHIEEPQLVNTFGRRDHTEPISQLLLLEELLCPALRV